MEGLLKRLSAEGSEAENALRVVAFFDQLVEHRSSPRALVRSTSRLIGASSGYSSDSGGESWSFDSIGRPIGSSVPPQARAQRVTTDGGINGTVWILPDSATSALADLVLERMAISVSIVLDRDPNQGQPATTALFMRWLDSGNSPEDRESYAHTLGFHSTWSVRSIVLKDFGEPDDLAQRLHTWSHRVGARCTQPYIADRLSTALFQVTNDMKKSDIEALPGLVAIGPPTAVIDAHLSVEAARNALRLCSSELGPRFVCYEDLGPLIHIAGIAPDVAKRDPFVIRLMTLAETDAGRPELVALDVFLRHSSLRSAAIELNLHHSSLAKRLDKVSRRLAVDLSDPKSRFELSLALWLYRVAMSA